jgi:ABC-2 type transport system permease protein
MTMFLLQLRNELWKLFGKRRTYIGFGMFLLVQNAMLIAFKVTKWKSQVEHLLEGNGYFAPQFISALTVAVFMLIPQVVLLMPLYTTLIGGDMVAKEAEDGTLRMILCRPISRFRLLFLKWIAGIIFSTALVAVLGVTALLLARIWFPWQGMFVFIPGVIFNVLDLKSGFLLYLCSHLFLIVNAATMLSFAFMFSCYKIKPAAATILALSILFVSIVMENIPFMENYHQWLVTYHFRSWVLVFAQPMPWGRVGGSLSILFACNLTAFIIGAAGFQVRDVKS